MEASSLRTAPGRAPLVAGAALLRLKGDEQLVTLVRRGHDGAFEVLFRRYQPRLLAFCRHMLGSTEDAEDVLQESFASAHRAMIADERPIVARAWLYRIARNRCLDHLRRPANADGQDSTDVFERGCGVSSEDLAHQRAEIRDVMGDIRALPEAQRSALLMREIDTLSHEQIAAAMETTVSSVKSLLVRARISLTEAARARSLTCDEVRLSIAEVEEGIAKAPPEARRHLKACQSCQGFKRDFRRTTRVLAAVCPCGSFLVAKNLLWGKLGAAFVGGGAASSGGSGAAATTAAA
ncbi:MAG: sigma-70 family RNA polymerase sigma factor [Actinomycetota bacterium]|nr:sigma-70 family RNA polymerase sigma factor [Actinomycetota bacterium]